jgi:hypothetical protein
MKVDSLSPYPYPCISDNDGHGWPNIQRPLRARFRVTFKIQVKMMQHEVSPYSRWRYIVLHHLNLYLDIYSLRERLDGDTWGIKLDYKSVVVPSGRRTKSLSAYIILSAIGDMGSWFEVCWKTI